MSLESALEEERISVVKQLEKGSHKQNKNARRRSQPPPSGYRHPVSLLLNDEPLETRDARDARSSTPGNTTTDHKPRSKSISATPRSSGSTHNRRKSSFDDPTDPLASPDSFYYTAGSLRKSLGSPSHSPRNSLPTSPTRPSMHPKSNSWYNQLNTTASTTTNNKFQDFYQETTKRLPKDYTNDDETSDGESESGEDEDEDDEAILFGDEELYNDDDEESDDYDEDVDLLAKSHSNLLLDEIYHNNTNIPKSESPSNVQLLKYKSLLDADGIPPKPNMAEYAAYKRRIIHPNTAFDTQLPPVDTPYTNDNEELIDAKKAAEMEMAISPVHSNINCKRVIRTMCRGDLPKLGDPSTPRQKSFIVSTDLSPEATHALEWTIGTVIRDGNVLYVVCTYEDDLSDKEVTANFQENERLQAIDKMTNSVSRLLKKTRLQVHVVLEVIHCKSPKHMLTEIIDHVTPTLVILGSRGRSALKGVLLGSFSNYIVERSSVPVMVARRKLQKTKNRNLNVRLANNLQSQGRMVMVSPLSTAKVD